MRLLSASELKVTVSWLLPVVVLGRHSRKYKAQLLKNSKKYNVDTDGDINKSTFIPEAI
jgi:hypothetical protein